MTQQERIDAERQELNLLINRGVNFDVERTVYKRIPGIIGFFKPRVKTTETLKFNIQEPTLSTLDRLSAEQIELVIDEAVMQSDNGVAQARKMVNQHCKRLARIVAIAALGQDYMQTVQAGGIVRYIPDHKKLDQLTEIFYKNIKPSKLLQLTILVNTMSNLGDFTNSIRLMSAARTTIPIRIEEEKD